MYYKGVIKSVVRTVCGRNSFRINLSKKGGINAPRLEAGINVFPDKSEQGSRLKRRFSVFISFVSPYKRGQIGYFGGRRFLGVDSYKRGVV